MRANENPVMILVVGFFLGMLFSAALLHFGGLKEAAPNLKSEAVERGYAEFVVIDSKGSTEFKWKEPQG